MRNENSSSSQAHRLDRRGALAFLSAVPLAASFGVTPDRAQSLVQGNSGSLASVARTRGLRFGSAAPLRALADKEFLSLMLRECDVTAALNELKWHVMVREGRNHSFADVDRFVTLAGNHGLRQRGHAIIWDRGRFMPAWLKGVQLSAHRAEQAIVERTRTVVGRYKHYIRSWDVVNEAVHFATGRAVRGPLVKAMGWDYAALAFHVARETDLRAELVYNDYVQPFRPAHQEGILRFLDAMTARDAPIDAIGIQGHVSMAQASEGLEEWPTFLGEIAARGLDILITELDVTDDGPQDDPHLRDRLAGEAIEQFLDATLQQSAVKEIVVRSLTDSYEGLSYAKPREDGLKRRPSPFDATNRRKPIGDAIARSIANAPRRSA